MMSRFLTCSYLWLLLVLPASCNSQVRKAVPAGSPNASKLIKTQGSNQYAVISCALQDKSGNIWFGTSGEGVYCYDEKHFTQFTEKEGFSNSVRAIIEDSAGNLWFGGKTALYRYDGKTFTQIPIPVNNGLGFYSFQPANGKASLDNELICIIQDRRGLFWIGTTDGVYCYNGTFFSRFLDNKNIEIKDSVSLKSVQCIFEDKTGAIWFGGYVTTGEGVCRYDGRTLKKFNPYGETWVRSVLEDKKGDLLIDTRHYGVCRFDGKTFVNLTRQGGIDNTSIATSLVDRAGNLWMGTELGSGQLGEDGGLWRYDGKTFTRFTTKDGLCHNGIFCLFEDKDGALWIGTRNTGLCRYDGNTFTNFSE